jgi:hypothetical protein
MKKYTLLKRATAAAMLSATLAAPAVAGLTAGTASARPMTEAQCVQLENEMFSYQIKMNDAQRANNQSEYRYWGKVYDNAQRHYSRGCK